MIKISGKTTDNGKEFAKKLQKEIAKMNNSYVTVGIHAGAGAYSDQFGRAGAGPEVAEVALWNEFGTKNMPARSFLRTTIDENEAEITSWRDEVCEQILAGEMTVKEALDTIGKRLTFMIQNKIKSNVPPPNAPSTAAHKKEEGVGSSTLIETGLMLRSVGHKVFVK